MPIGGVPGYAEPRMALITRITRAGPVAVNQISVMARDLLIRAIGVIRGPLPGLQAGFLETLYTTARNIWKRSALSGNDYRKNIFSTPFCHRFVLSVSIFVRIMKLDDVDLPKNSRRADKSIDCS
jgi:hypothetical protein